VEKWTLARRAKVLVSEQVLPANYYPGTFAMPNQMDASGGLWDLSTDLYDNWECERWSLEYWSNVSIQRLFLLGGSYSGYMVQSPTTAAMSWIRRPVITATSDPTTQAGTQMCFLPGCAEFKVQRWIETDPVYGTPLPPGEARWYPEEDRDGDGLVDANGQTAINNNDFYAMTNLPGFAGGALSPTAIREYFNGPRPTIPDPGPGRRTGVLDTSQPSSTRYYLGADGPWYYYPEREVPKAIKVTVRLLDPNKRLADGQVLTMTFGLAGTQQ
jgi:hypothetical protein